MTHRWWRGIVVGATVLLTTRVRRMRRRRRDLGRDTPTLTAYGHRSTVEAQMQVLGLRNVFGDIDKRAFEPTVEEIIARDPSVIILLPRGDQSAESARKALVDKAELAGSPRSVTTTSSSSRSATPGRARSPSKAWK